MKNTAALIEDLEWEHEVTPEQDLSEIPFPSEETGSLFGYLTKKEALDAGIEESMIGKYTCRYCGAEFYGWRSITGWTKPKCCPVCGTADSYNIVISG